MLQEHEFSSGVTLRFPKLHDANYRSWKFDMRMFLLERGLFGFIDDVQPEVKPTPEEETQHPGVTRQYDFRASRALATIALGLEPSLKTLIRNCSSAKEAWQALAAVYEPKSRARIGQLRKEFVLLKMGHQEPMAKYLSRVDNSKTDLEDAGKKIDEEELAYQMLCGLSAEWDSVVERLYALDDTNFKPRVLKENLLNEYERRHPTQPASTYEDLNSYPVAAQIGEYRQDGRKSRKDNGRPPRGRTRNKNRRSTSQKRIGKCYGCGGEGHYKSECPSVKKTQSSGNTHKPSRGKQDEVASYFVEAMNTSTMTSKWLFDTAATNHFCADKDWFNTFREVESRSAALAEGTSQIHGIGDISLVVTCGEKQNQIMLKNVLFAPKMRRNLISGIKVFLAGHLIVTSPKGLYVTNKSGNIQMDAPFEANFFVVHGEIVKSPRMYSEIVPHREETNVSERPKEEQYAITVSKNRVPKKNEDHSKEGVETDHRQAIKRPRFLEKDKSNLQENKGTSPQKPIDKKSNTPKSDPLIWHERLGHINYQALRKMEKDNQVRGLPPLSSQDPVCDACRLGKSTRTKHVALSERITKEPLALIYSDVWGPATTTSNGGSKYFITFVDDYTRKCWIYIMRSKDQAFEMFKKFLSHVERETGKKVKTLRTDNGMEYCAKYFKDELSRLGIRTERTNVYSPEQNGVAERLNRTLLDSVRTILISSKLSAGWWAELVLTAAHVKNKIAHSGLHGQIPDALYYGKQPTVSYMRRIGSLCFIHDEGKPRTKLQPRAVLRCFDWVCAKYHWL